MPWRQIDMKRKIRAETFSINRGRNTMAIALLLLVMALIVSLVYLVY